MASTDARISEIESEMLSIAARLDDLDPPAAFALRQHTRFYTDIPFKTAVQARGGRVRIFQALALYHGPPRGRFLLAAAGSASPSPYPARRSCLERTLRAALHGLPWRGAELVLASDLRGLDAELRDQLVSQALLELRRHKSHGAQLFVLPWRSLRQRSSGQEARGSSVSLADSSALQAADRLSLASPVDIYEQALMSLFPTICASRGLRMDQCNALIRGRGSWAFRVAEALHAQFGAKACVELAGRRYRPAAAKSPHHARAHHQHGRWEPEEREPSAHPDLVVLLGGGEAVTEANAAELRCSVVFPLHRDSLTLTGEVALRDRAVMVVPHLLLSSAEELAAVRLADPDYCRALCSADQQSLPRLDEDFRIELRHRMIAAWDQIQARAKEDRSVATRAALSLAADRLLSELTARPEARRLPPGAP